MEVASGAAALRRQLERLRAYSDHPLAPDDQEALKRLLADLYRHVRSELAELTEIQERIRVFANAMREQASKSAAGMTRQDHLGASTHIEKGWSLLARGEAVEAEAAFRRGLALSPGDLRAQALVAWAIMQQGRLDEAMERLLRLLGENPESPLAWMGLGYIALRRQEFGEAIEHLMRAIRHGGDRVATLYSNYYLGVLYLEREMYDDARVFLERAVALGPAMGEAYYELGRAHWLAGRLENARASWSAGAERSALGRWGPRCAAMLQSIERPNISF